MSRQNENIDELIINHIQEEIEKNEREVEPYTTNTDGDCWFCCGESFVNLQESENYGYGNTEQEAIDNYIQKEKRKD